MTRKPKREHPQRIFRHMLPGIQQRMASGGLILSAQLPSWREFTNVYGVSSLNFGRARDLCQHQGPLRSVGRGGKA